MKKSALERRLRWWSVMALAAYCCVGAGAQSAPELKFEVASIKPNKSGTRSFGTRQTPGGRLTVRNETLPQLIDFAYDIGEFWRILAGESSRIVGGPRWILSEHYDVIASAGREVTPEEMRPMLRALLKERFKLAVHHEAKEQPIYALRMLRAGGGLGPQLRRLTVDCDQVGKARAAAVTNGTPLPPNAANGAPQCGAAASEGELKSSGQGLDVLAMRMSKEAGRTVVNETGLSGNYEVTLRFSPADSGVGGASGDRPSIFLAVKEQLGLKLEATRGPVDVLVIDHVERPTPD
jgi:uncharacterized protein (TIGR03435 family)